MRPNKDRRTEIILYGLLLIPLLFAAAALAQATEPGTGAGGNHRCTVRDSEQPVHAAVVRQHA